MKKLMAILLVATVLICSAAIAEDGVVKVHEGITLDDFLNWRQEGLDYTFKEAPARLLQLNFTENEKGAQIIKVEESDISIIISTFPGTDIIEFAGIAIADQESDFLLKQMVSTVSAMFDYDNCYTRLQKLTLALESGGGARKGVFQSEYTIFSTDNYLGYIFLFSSKTSVICFVHEDSELDALGTETYAYVLYFLVTPELAKATQPKLDSVDVNTVTLSIGEWECPAHIASGEYSVTPVKSATIYVYRGEELVIAEYLDTSENDEIGRLVLEAGDRIEIGSGKLEFKPFE